MSSFFLKIVARRNVWFFEGVSPPAFLQAGRAAMTEMAFCSSLILPKKCFLKSRILQLPAEPTDLRQVQAQHFDSFGFLQEVPDSPLKIYGGKDFPPGPKLAACAFLDITFMCALGKKLGLKTTLKQTFFLKHL